MLLRSLCLAVALIAAAPAVRADALPMPIPIDAFQESLIGTWQEDPNQPDSWGRGHGFAQRTVFFGNDTVVITTFAGLTYSNEYYATTVVGRWTATRADDGAIKVKLVQSDTRGTELTIILDGENGLFLQDAEGPPASARFTRVGEKIKVNK